LQSNSILPFIPPTQPFHAPLFILPYSELVLCTILFLIRSTCSYSLVPRSHLASAPLFLFSPGGSDRLASLKHLNKPMLVGFSRARSLHSLFYSAGASNSLASLNQLNKPRSRSVSLALILFLLVVFSFINDVLNSL
jgi:hypothetical protein